MKKKRSTSAKVKRIARGAGVKTKKRRLNLPVHVVAFVWARAAGRCEFLGCNVPVWKDVLTTHNANVGKLAHIVAASIKGPRGHRTDSPKLAKEASNIMLLCGTHHDLVDDKKLEGRYPVKLLRDYKKRHEERIERLTRIQESRRSATLLLQIPVGQMVLDSSPEELDRALAAEEYYPDDSRRMTIDLNGMLGRDHDGVFWDEARKAIADRLAQQVRGATHGGPLEHVSVFAFGPMPLLIYLGYLLDEKGTANVYNRHRKPKGWVWPKDTRRISKFELLPPSSVQPEVALVLSVTSQVQRAAMHAVVPATMPVFEITWTDPALDCVRFPGELDELADVARRTMEEIHRAGVKRVHVFPAVPVAVAVEFGRVLQKKLHPPMVLYDHHSGTGGWSAAFTLAARTTGS